MPTVEARLLSKPDETRPFESHGQVELVNIAGNLVGRGTFEPGWMWSRHVKPIAGTDLCDTSHFGYCVSGRMTIKMADGDEVEFGPGTIVSIPPGHDAWVDGDEPCVFIDFGDIAKYAKR